MYDVIYTAVLLFNRTEIGLTFLFMTELLKNDCKRDSLTYVTNFVYELILSPSPLFLKSPNWGSRQLHLRGRNLERKQNK